MLRKCDRQKYFNRSWGLKWLGLNAINNLLSHHSNSASGAEEMAEFFAQWQKAHSYQMDVDFDYSPFIEYILSWPFKLGVSGVLFPQGKSRIQEMRLKVCNICSWKLRWTSLLIIFLKRSKMDGTSNVWFRVGFLLSYHTSIRMVLVYHTPVALGWFWYHTPALGGFRC